MTLRKAQKMYDDAVIVKLWHEKWEMTKCLMEKIGMFTLEPQETQYAKVLFVKIGRKSSYVISSHKALLQETNKQ